MTITLPKWAWIILSAIILICVGAYFMFIQATKSLVYENTTIPYEYKDNYSMVLPAGACNIVTRGKNGTDIKTYQVTYRAGKVVNKALTDEKIVQPTTEVKTRGANINLPLTANYHSDCQ